jgi:hypothetical protein
VERVSRPRKFSDFASKQKQNLHDLLMQIGAVDTFLQCSAAFVGTLQKVLREFFAFPNPARRSARDDFSAITTGLRKYVFLRERRIRIFRIRIKFPASMSSRLNWLHRTSLHARMWLLQRSFDCICAEREHFPAAPWAAPSPAVAITNSC